MRSARANRSKSGDNRGSVAKRGWRIVRNRGGSKSGAFGSLDGCPIDFEIAGDHRDAGWLSTRLVGPLGRLSSCISCQIHRDGDAYCFRVSRELGPLRLTPGPTGRTMAVRGRWAFRPWPVATLMEVRTRVVPEMEMPNRRGDKAPPTPPSTNDEPPASGRIASVRSVVSSRVEKEIPLHKLPSTIAQLCRDGRTQRRRLIFDRVVSITCIRIYLNSQDYWRNFFGNLLAIWRRQACGDAI